jgi:hypothetical protein
LLLHQPVGPSSPSSPPPFPARFRKRRYSTQRSERSPRGRPPPCQGFPGRVGPLSLQTTATGSAILTCTFRVLGSYPRSRSTPGIRSPRYAFGPKNRSCRGRMRKVANLKEVLLTGEDARTPEALEPLFLPGTGQGPPRDSATRLRSLSHSRVLPSISAPPRPRTWFARPGGGGT